MEDRRFGVLVYNGAYGGVTNLGDDIQALAAQRLLPRLDYRIDRERTDLFASRFGEPVHTVMNGWFSHAPDHWPPSAAVHPLVTSFHISRGPGASGYPRSAAEMFFEGDARRWLERYAPIGCRDLDTLEQCRAAGLDAFFSGCLTLTLSRPDLPREEDLIVLNDAPLAVINRVMETTSKKIQLTKHYRRNEGDEGRREATARDLLRLYARASCVITTRLHCALPCLAFGTPVLLIDAAFDQYRFSGLNDLLLHATEADFLAEGVAFDINAPPAARLEHRPLAKALRDSVEAFTGRGTGDPVAGSLRPTADDEAGNAPRSHGDAALSDCEAAAAVHPANPWSLRQLSEAQFVRGRHAEALETASRACALGSQDPLYDLWFCQVLAALGRLGEAATALDDAQAHGLDAPTVAWHRDELQRRSTSWRREVIYEDADLLVRHAHAGRSPTLVITFAHIETKPDKRLSGFGETFITKAGYNSIYFTCADNAWYQYPGMTAAVAKARNIASRYDRVICYGSSMGAYAAYRFADALGADLTLAIAPQFTPDPRAKPFDRRWASEIAAVGFKDQEPPSRVSNDFVVLFDPRNGDAAHVAELRRRYRVQEVALPFAGHEVATTLARVGLLGSIVRQIIDGVTSAEEVASMFKSRRRRSVQYLINMAHATNALGRKLWLIEQALRLTPDDGVVLCMLGDVLLRRGDPAAARSAYARAATLRPDDPWPLYLTADVDLNFSATAPVQHFRAWRRTVRPPLQQVAGRLMWLERFDEAVEAVGDGVARGFDAAEGDALLRDIVLLKAHSLRRLAGERLMIAQAEPDIRRRLALLRAVASDGGDALAHRLSGGVYMQLNDVSAAAEAFRAATELDPDHAWGWIQLGEALYADGRPEEGLQAVRRALQLEPSNTAHAPLQLSLLIAMGRLDEAQACLAGAVRIGFPQADADWWGSEIQRRGDQARLADAARLAMQAEAETDILDRLQMLRQAAYLAPSLSYVQFRLGEALMQRGDVDAAVEAFSQAGQLSPDAAWPLYNLASALQVSGRRQEAFDAAQQALELADDAIYHLMSAQTLIALGRDQAALAALAAALERGADQTDVEWLRNILTKSTVERTAPDAEAWSDAAQDAGEVERLSVATLSADHPVLTS